jgi:excisionase family DNA binding protein
MIDLEVARTRATLNVEEAARLLGISRTVAFEQARRYVETGGAEGIPALRIGRRLLIPTSRLLSWLEGNERERGASAQVRDAARGAVSHAGAV